MDIKLRTLIGRDIAPHISELAKLRITIFREYPYLYEGDPTYEQKYLTRYTNCQHAMVILALDGETPIGMSSCLPLAEEEEFKDPFVIEGIDTKQVFYFGESILLPLYRGQGLGKKFFELREAHAKSVLKGNLKYTAFCAVNREEKAPSDYRSPEFLWKKYGYVKRPDLIATYHWKDLGDQKETPKTLTFWLKEHS